MLQKRELPALINEPIPLNESYKLGEALKNIRIPLPQIEKIQTQTKKERKLFLDYREIYMIRGDSRRRGMKKLHSQLHHEKQRNFLTPMSEYCKRTADLQKKQRGLMKRIRKKFSAATGSGDIIRAQNKRAEKKMDKMRKEVLIGRSNLLNQNQQAKLFLLEIVDLKEKVERADQKTQNGNLA